MKIRHLNRSKRIGRRTSVPACRCCAERMAKATLTACDEIAEQVDDAWTDDIPDEEDR